MLTDNANEPLKSLKKRFVIRNQFKWPIYLFMKEYIREAQTYMTNITILHYKEMSQRNAHPHVKNVYIFNHHCIAIM